MKTLLLTATYLVGIGELILAIFFWVTAQKQEVRKVLGMLTFFTSIWVLLSAFVAYRTNTEIPDNFLFMFGALLITALMHFSFIFPYRLFQFDRLHASLLYVPAVLFSIIAFTTNSISVGSYSTPMYAGEVIPGPIYPIYNLFFAFIFLVSIGIFIYRFVKSSGLHKVLVGRVLLGIILGGLPAVFIDLLQHSFFPGAKPNFLYGSLLTSVWLGIIGYTVLKK